MIRPPTNEQYGLEEAKEGWQKPGALMLANRGKDGELRKTVQAPIARAALRALQDVDCVDASRVAVVGFCYGGQCAMDVAKSVPTRDGLRGWVSVHGIVGSSNIERCGGERAQGLILHGLDDPFVPVFMDL